MTSPNKYPNIAFFTANMVGAWAVIGLTTYYGDKTNSLHTSAQAWAFSLVIAILAVYGLASTVLNWSAPK
jgi:hypothetical protein